MRDNAPCFEPVGVYKVALRLTLDYVVGPKHFAGRSDRWLSA